MYYIYSAGHTLRRYYFSKFSDLTLRNACLRKTPHT